MNLMHTILVVAGLCLAPTLSAGELKPFDGPTPGLELPDLEGKTHHLADYRGKVVVVQFWATYCTPCRTEMPSMNRLLEKMDDKLAILAVDMSEPPEQVQKFVDEVKPAFPVLLDEKGDAIQAWKVFAVPSSFVLDPAGKIRYTLYGATEWDAPEMRQALTGLLPSN
ncbi:MAG: TlpA disulfide reductase family protein [Pseudomonadota bacterium]|nr:TlpA disulfide reductase family protein [Pseudomonadota bacterium]